MKIPEIPIEKQYEVSRIIDKTRIIIEQRKQELTNLDELMKARFVEMFGTYPSAFGLIVCVLEIPSRASSYGSFATEFREARRPFFSAP